MKRFMPERKGFSDLGESGLIEDSIISENRNTNSYQTYYKMVFSIIFTIFAMLSIPVFAQEEMEQPELKYASGKVLEIIKENINEEISVTFQEEQTAQLVKVQVISGEHAGEVVEIENYLTSNPIYDINVKPGNRVVLNIEETPEGNMFYIADIERYPILMIVTGVFLGLLVLIGGRKGMRAILSLCITASLVIFLLVPAILNNYPPIPSAVVVALVSTLLTMAVVGGINLKSLAASLGTIFSVTLAGIIALLVIKFAPLTGFHDQESAMLWMSRNDLNFSGILAAAVIIGALGAVMDVGMSIASSITELKKVNNDLTPKELVKSGMNVGKDIMGTMANTLILAYIGGAFSLVLLAAKAPFVKLINLNSIATEITSAITGSIGIVLCVPITAVIAAYLIGSRENAFDAEFSQIDAIQDGIEIIKEVE